MWVCADCEVEHDLDPDVEENQIVECLECGAEFEVLSLDPLELERLQLADADDDDLSDADDDVDDD